ncbi:MAG: hypothetical protein ACK4N5_24945, partial [Myxococcales bacterium]
MLRRALIGLALVAAACGGEALPPVPPPPTPDTTAPEITNLKVTPERAGRGSKVTATLTVSEELKRLVVSIAGRTAECAASGNDHTCSFTLAGDESEGAQIVEVRATDLAGNLGTATAKLTLDYTAPKITFSSQPPVLSNQTSATVAFTADEEGTFKCA